MCHRVFRLLRVYLSFIHSIKGHRAWGVFATAGVMVLRLDKSLKYRELIHTPDCSGPAPTFITFDSEYCPPAVASTMPEKTPFHCPDFPCWKKFTSDSWQLKHIKFHHPEHLHIAKNSTVCTAPRSVQSAQPPEFNANNNSVEDLDQFRYFEYAENIAASMTYQARPPLLCKETFPGVWAPLTNYSAQLFEHNTQSFLERNWQNNSYYPFVMRQQYKYIQCGIRKKGVKMYYHNMRQEENPTLCFLSFKTEDWVLMLVATKSDVLAVGEWELQTLEDMRWNDNYQRPIKYWSRDILKSMRCFMWQPTYAEHLFYAPQLCFNSYTPLKILSTEMHTAGCWWETQVLGNTPLSWHANQQLANAQSGGYTGSLDLHVRQNISLEFCWRQERVACIYANWQSIFEDPPVALNAQCLDGRTPADSNQEPQYSSEITGWAVANTPRGAK